LSTRSGRLCAVSDLGDMIRNVSIVRDLPPEQRERLSNLSDVSVTLHGYYDVPLPADKADVVVMRPKGLMTRVTVVTPMMSDACVRRRQYRAQMIESVQRQTEPCAWIGAYDRGQGAAGARNAALNLVQSDWVAFIDDDDLIDPDHVAKLLAHALASGADVVYPRFRIEGGDYSRRRSLGDLAWIMDDVDGREPEVFAETLRAGNFIPVTVLARTSAVRAVGGFPVGEAAPQHPFPPYPRLEDWGLWLRMLANGARFAHLPEVTWTWRQWDGSTSAAYVGGA
jgi:hypothetical protein